MHMETILKRCAATVEDLSKKEIPQAAWKNCAGVAIINISETGFVVSIAEGDGVLLKHNCDGNSWSAPSALKFTGSSAGAVFGKAKLQVILFPMSQYAFNMLTADMKYELGAQIGLAAGPYSREASLTVGAGGHGVDVTYSYVFEEGAFLKKVESTTTFSKMWNRKTRPFMAKRWKLRKLSMGGLMVLRFPEAKVLKSWWPSSESCRRETCY